MKFKRFYYIGVVAVFSICILSVLIFCKHDKDSLYQTICGIAGRDSFFLVALSFLFFCIFLCYENRFNAKKLFTKKVFAFVGSLTFDIYLLGNIVLFLMTTPVALGCKKYHINFDVCGVLLLGLITWIGAGLLAVLMNLIKKLLTVQIKKCINYFNY